MQFNSFMQFTSVSDGMNNNKTNVRLFFATQTGNVFNSSYSARRSDQRAITVHIYAWYFSLWDNNIFYTMQLIYVWLIPCNTGQLLFLHFIFSDLSDTKGNGRINTSHLLSILLVVVILLLLRLIFCEFRPVI